MNYCLTIAGGTVNLVSLHAQGMSAFGSQTGNEKNPAEDLQGDAEEEETEEQRMEEAGRSERSWHLETG